jgi:hypothetical protein
MFKIGDHAIATTAIVRQDGESKVNKGERVKITSVFHGEKYTIVSIEPCSGASPMIDICCNHDGPLQPSS